MVGMAGRPRKHPAGIDLVTLKIKLTPEVKEATRAGAAARGLTMTDYLAALVAKDLRRNITGAPALPEVIELRTA